MTALHESTARSPSAPPQVIPDRGPALIQPSRAPGTPAVADGGYDPGLALPDVTELRRIGRQHASVARLGQVALQGGPLDGLLDVAARLAAQTLDAPYALVFETLGAPAADGGLFARAAVGWPGSARAIGHVRSGDLPAFLHRTLAGPAPVAVADLRDEGDARPPGDRTAAAWHRSLAGPELGGSLSVRLDVGGEAPYGVLVVLTGAARCWRADESDFLAAVASVISLAVRRYRVDEQVRRQALHDPLSGLANRTLLQDRLGQALAVQRRTGQACALLLMDLDGFKDINDTLGHDAGDQVLQVIGGRLAQSTRDSDTVARLGGDEFAVVLPSVGSVDDAVRVAQKLRASVAQRITVADLPLHVDASVGIALAPTHGDDPVALLKHADVAMYHAKSAASGVDVYRWEADQHAPERLAYISALRRAIEEDQLELHYAPRRALGTGQVTAYEAVVHWRHPAAGLLGPQDFLPLAEQTGLVEPLTRRVLALALASAYGWHAAGRTDPLAVNISARVLHETDLVGDVKRALRRAGLPPSALELQVAESAVMTEPHNAARVLARLRGAGVRLSLDHFGAGHVALAHLRTLPVSSIRIDRSLVRDLGRDDAARSIVRGLIDLGHTLGLAVVGEGVDTAQTWQLLGALGCDEATGSYLGGGAPAGGWARPALVRPA